MPTEMSIYWFSRLAAHFLGNRNQIHKLNTLPDLCLLAVFSRIKLYELLCTGSLVCKKWNTLISLVICHGKHKLYLFQFKTAKPTRNYKATFRMMEQIRFLKLFKPSINDYLILPVPQTTESYECIFGKLQHKFPNLRQFAFYRSPEKLLLTVDDGPFEDDDGLLVEQLMNLLTFWSSKLEVLIVSIEDIESRVLFEAIVNRKLSLPKLRSLSLNFGAQSEITELNLSRIVPMLEGQLEEFNFGCDLFPDNGSSRDYENLKEFFVELSKQPIKTLKRLGLYVHQYHKMGRVFLKSQLFHIIDSVTSHLSPSERFNQIPLNRISTRNVSLEDLTKFCDNFSTIQHLSVQNIIWPNTQPFHLCDYYSDLIRALLPLKHSLQSLKIGVIFFDVLFNQLCLEYRTSNFPVWTNWRRNHSEVVKRLYGSLETFERVKVVRINSLFNANKSDSYEDQIVNGFTRPMQTQSLCPEGQFYPVHLAVKLVFPNAQFCTGY